MKKKMWGAIALSAALAMGSAVPAFALTANDATAGETGGFGDGTNGTVLNAGSTDVKVLAEVTQINATLPMEVTVVADIQGGALKYVPTGDLGFSKNSTASATGYRIENHTVGVPIKVTSVKASESDATKWVYSDTALSKGDAYKVGAATNTLGRINLTVAPNAGAASSGAATTITKAAAVTLSGNAWKVGKAADESTPGLLGLQLNGTTSYVNTDSEIDADKAATAVKLTYTIAVDGATQAPAAPTGE